MLKRRAPLRSSGISRAPKKPKSGQSKASTPKKKKTLSVSTAKTRADKAFSIYIRTRDSVRGICACVTCGAQRPIAQTHCGHFVSRRYLSTRYDERNAHAQCPTCNTYNQGEQYLHGVHVDRRWGEGTADMLMRKSREINKMRASDYLEVEEKYKNLLLLLTTK